MIPNLFKKVPITQINNPDLLLAIDEVKHSKDREEAIKKAYFLIENHYRGYHFLTYILFWKAFEGNPNKLWEKKGFMHCHQQNFLLRLLLVKSGWVDERDIRLGFSLVWYVSLHQYLIVKEEGKVLALDPWNWTFGVKLGEYASGFGSRKLP